MGRPVPIRAGVGASFPLKGELLTAKLLPIDASRGLSARPLHPFGSPSEAIERPLGLQALFPRRSRRVRPHRGQGFAPTDALGAFLGANNRRVNPRRGLCLPPSHPPFFLLY